MNFLAVIIFILFTISRFTFATDEKNQACESSREFITTFEFLREHSSLNLSGDMSLKIANEVAKGCSGAAKRFIQTVKTLQKADFPIGATLETAKEFAKRDDKTVEVFISIFKKAYAEDGFDLDLTSSLEVGKALSVNFKGDALVALSDFNKISDFCISEQNLDLPKPTCVELAKRVALLSDKHGFPVGSKFIQAYKYFVEKKGPELTVKDALIIAESLMKDHPSAFDNFKLGYEYALSKKGLNISKEQAIKFGKQMAVLSIPEVKFEREIKGKNK